MLKRIPKTIRYMGYPIAVEQISQEVMDDLCDEPGVPGLWRANYKEAKFTIYLVKDPDVMEMWDTLWHEMGHAYLDVGKHDLVERDIDG